MRRDRPDLKARLARLAPPGLRERLAPPGLPAWATLARKDRSVLRGTRASQDRPARLDLRVRLAPLDRKEFPARLGRRAVREPPGLRVSKERPE